MHLMNHLIQLRFLLILRLIVMLILLLVLILLTIIIFPMPQFLETSLNQDHVNLHTLALIDTQEILANIQHEIQTKNPQDQLNQPNIQTNNPQDQLNHTNIDTNYPQDQLNHPNI